VHAVECLTRIFSASEIRAKLFPKGQHGRPKKHGKAFVPDATETPQPGKKPTLVQNDSPGDSYQQHANLHPGDAPEEK
jgi:hypothetical protein